VAAAVLLLALLQVIVGTTPGWLKNPQLSLPILDRQLLLLYPAQPAVNTRYAVPNPAPWPLHSLLSYALLVGNLETLPRDQLNLAVIPNHPGIEEHSLRFEAYRRRMPIRIETAYPENLWNQDVLIHKTGDWGWPPSFPTIESVLVALSEPASDFQLMPRTFALPDGGEALVYARKPSPLLASTPSPQYPTQVEFGTAARFLGFDALVEGAVAGDQTVTVTYYWESLAPAEQDYAVFVHLLDPETGEIVVQDDHPLFEGIYPTSLWQADRFLFERRAVQLPASNAGSNLVLRLGLYSQDGRLPVTSPAELSEAGATFADVGLISLRP
jgi:hypothetical protein